jgi:hypothetical protein
MSRIFILIALLALALPSTSCRSTMSDLRNIESLDDVKFGNLQAKASAVVSLGLGPLVRNGTVSGEDLEEIAAVLDALGSGVLSTGPGGLISDALRKEGFTQQEIVGVFLILEEVLADRGVDLGFAAPGPRASAFLHTLADAVRVTQPIDPDGSVSSVPEEQEHPL